MTSYFAFRPSTTQQFTFSPVLDGQTYNASVPWNEFAQRYYLNLAALDGTEVLLTALVGSATGVAILSLSWANGRAYVTTSLPHGYKIASTVELTVAGCTPDAYNGRFGCVITGPTTFWYPLANDPGSATAFGNASYNVSLIGGAPQPDGSYFTSTLVFRTSSQTFEVAP